MSTDLRIRSHVYDAIPASVLLNTEEAKLKSIVMLGDDNRLLIPGECEYQSLISPHHTRRWCLVSDPEQVAISTVGRTAVFLIRGSEAIIQSDKKTRLFSHYEVLPGLVHAFDFSYHSGGVVVYVPSCGRMGVITSVDQAPHGTSKYKTRLNVRVGEEDMKIDVAAKVEACYMSENQDDRQLLLEALSSITEAIDGVNTTMRQIGGVLIDIRERLPQQASSSESDD